MIILSHLQETTHEILFNHISLLFLPDHLMERPCLPYSFKFPLIQLLGPDGPGSRLHVVRVLAIDSLQILVILSQFIYIYK